MRQCDTNVTHSQVGMVMEGLAEGGTPVGGEGGGHQWVAGAAPGLAWVNLCGFHPLMDTVH